MVFYDFIIIHLFNWLCFLIIIFMYLIVKHFVIFICERCYINKVYLLTYTGGFQVANYTE